MNNLKRLAVFSAITLVSLPAFSQTIDTSFVADMELNIVTIVGAIGTSLLLAGGLAVAYKWGKGALFG